MVERMTPEEIERGEHLWYIVLKHTNRRIPIGETENDIYDDYDTVNKRAAQMSRYPNSWYVPIRISEYNETFGRFNTTGPVTVDVDGWLTINVNGVAMED